MMSLAPELIIGLWSAWWLVAVYALLNLFLIVLHPQHFSKRVFGVPEFNSRKERIFSMLNFILYIGVMSYCVFLPLKLSTIWLYMGLAIFTLGMFLYAIAMINYANTSPDRPVTKGIYHISRHPMQVTAIIIWLGAGVATTSWIVILACIAQAILSYPSMVAQERFCIDKYGESYREYMKTTPRYFLFF
jgi:protein-S-isoprenylcysteine O-methyltransferase Ste14